MNYTDNETKHIYILVYSAVLRRGVYWEMGQWSERERMNAALPKQRPVERRADMLSERGEMF